MSTFTPFPFPLPLPHSPLFQTGAALKTHEIWQSAIGHDPHAPAPDPMAPEGKGPGVNPFEAQKGLFAMAKLSGNVPRKAESGW